jgi:hypothetical protein
MPVPEAQELFAFNAWASRRSFAAVAQLVEPD